MTAPTPPPDVSFRHPARPAAILALLATIATTADIAGKAQGAFPTTSASTTNLQPTISDRGHLAGLLRTAIAALVDVLDEIDGYADLEPSLGWTSSHQDWPSQILGADDGKADDAYHLGGSVFSGIDSRWPVGAVTT